MIGFRNTKLILLKDFQNKFYNYFKIKPYLIKGQRCRIQSKEIYNELTKEFSYYSYKWKMPKLSKENLRYWLRAFFDCESWVECVKGKNRAIKLECVNSNGIKDIKKALKKFKIDSKLKKRIRKDKIIYRLGVFGLGNIKKFHNKIGFLHPNKKLKLIEVLNSYNEKVL